jgi:glutathione S-transferase
MIEVSLYFILLYSRWIDQEGFKTVQAEFIPLFPPLIGRPFLNFIKRNLTRQAMAQGLGRHTKDEIYKMGQIQVQALAESLGEKKFFFSKRLTCFDATAYAFLSTIIKQPIDSELKRSVLQYKNLCAYVERLDEVMKGSS